MKSAAEKANETHQKLKKSWKGKWFASEKNEQESHT